MDDDSLAESMIELVDDESADDSMGPSADDSVAEGSDDGGWADHADGDVQTDIGATESAAWTRPDVTGVANVDAALDELGRLDALPTSEHVAVYDGLHRQLQDALADLDGA